MSEIKFVEVKGVRTRYLEAGAGDPLVLYHGAEFPRALIASQVPRSELHVFNEAGHHSFREHPEGINRVVTAFLSGV